MFKRPPVTVIPDIDEVGVARAESRIALRIVSASAVGFIER